MGLAPSGLPSSARVRRGTKVWMHGSTVGPVQCLPVARRELTGCLDHAPPVSHHTFAKRVHAWGQCPEVVDAITTNKLPCGLPRGEKGDVRTGKTGERQDAHEGDNGGHNDLCRNPSTGGMDRLA